MITESVKIGYSNKYNEGFLGGAPAESATLHNVTYLEINGNPVFDHRQVKQTVPTWKYFDNGLYIDYVRPEDQPYVREVRAGMFYIGRVTYDAAREFANARGWKEAS